MNTGKVKIASMHALSPVLSVALDNNSCVKFEVTGNSMYPLFRNNGDMVVIKKNSVISKYDILLYQRENGDYIIHRVVKIKNNALYMAGDNETVLEYPIYGNQVLATVESFYRNGKHISCGNPIYKLYSFLWVMIIPIRHKVIANLKRLQYAVRSRR